MKVAILSYPMLFQTQGGLQIQILESIEALKRRGVDARLIDPTIEHLTDFDVVHVFSAINGNRRIVEQAKALGLPTVCSPLIRPHWNRRLGQYGRLLDRFAGWLTKWEIKTEYRQIESCLRNSDVLLALGEIERRSITEAFNIPAARIRVVPNGIPPRFLSADPAPARLALAGDEPFVLCAATINPHKNQLGLARANVESGRRVVLIGECLPANRPYLDKVLAFPHVTYLGKLDYHDPMLASFYAAADAFCLASDSEVMPLCVLEALAAGTPVVMTRNHCMNLAGMEKFVLEVDPRDDRAIGDALERLFANPPSAATCRAAVAHFTWDAVAEQIHEAYIEVLEQHLQSRPDMPGLS